MDVVQHQSFVPLIQAKTALIGLVMLRKLIDLRFAVKGWLAIAKLKPLSLLVSLLSMPKKAFDNVKIDK